MNDPVAEKKTLRTAMLARRPAFHAAAPAAAILAARHFLDAIPLPAGATVSAYIALSNELDTAPLMELLRARGHEIALPRVVWKGQPLVFHRYEPGAKLVPGVFGLSQPASDWPVTVPDVLAVPLLAFDAQGNRLGYGAGFYDRTLRALRAEGDVLSVGYAFAGQETDEVPHHAGDEKLDWVVTETGARKFGR